MKMKREFIYYDGCHKSKVFGIRQATIAESLKNKYLTTRMKNFIQVKIHFLNQFYVWININRNELIIKKS